MLCWLRHLHEYVHMKGGAHMAEPKLREESLDQLQYALGIMREAIEALDSAGAPADIGAHLDRAILRLEEVLSGSNRG
jgi:hypothetical protein